MTRLRVLIFGGFLAACSLLAALHPEVVGRVLHAQTDEPVTFNRQVVRILQARCQTCHHEGAIAPFPLMTYQDAYERKESIRSQAENRRMPPWHVSSACADFQDNPSLSEEEIGTIARWVEAGAPEGDLADLPPPTEFGSGWSLGQPDLILNMEEPMTPDFSRGDVYRCFVFPTNLGEDRFVSAVEILPGVRSMVHHVLLFVDTEAQAVKLDREDPGPGYTCFGGPGFSFLWTLGGWAPGNQPKFLPDGVGMFLPKNSHIVMQVHYSARSGKTEADQTTIGLHFARKPVQKRLLVLPVVNNRFRIPAGDANYRVTAAIPLVPFEIHLLGITPHMHLLGKKMTVTATTRDGREVCLVDVPDWDFHWQRTYLYKEPLALPAFTRFDLTAFYDNSPDNPSNPNIPPQDVTWGENTTDEMCIAFLHFTLDLENLSASPGLAPTRLDSFPPFWQVDLAAPAQRPSR